MVIRTLQIRYTITTTGAEVVDVDAVEALEEEEEGHNEAEEEEVKEAGTTMGKEEVINQRLSCSCEGGQQTKIKLSLYSYRKRL